MGVFVNVPSGTGLDFTVDQYEYETIPDTFDEIIHVQRNRPIL